MSLLEAIWLEEARCERQCWMQWESPERQSEEQTLEITSLIVRARPSLHTRRPGPDAALIHACSTCVGPGSAAPSPLAQHKPGQSSPWGGKGHQEPWSSSLLGSLLLPLVPKPGLLGSGQRWAAPISSCIRPSLPSY